MEILLLSKAFTLIEPGPVVLVTTNDGQKDNVMTITWTMVIGFSAAFAITTGPWNHSYAALLETKECVISIPTVDLIDMAIGVGTCSGEDTDKFEKFGPPPLKPDMSERRSSRSASQISNAGLSTSSTGTASSCSKALPHILTVPARRKE